LQQRHQFDTAKVDDVVMGIVSPVGDQGAVLPKVAALKAGWDFQAAGVQVNRFCASGLEAVNMAAQKVRSGWEDLVVAGGVESMSRVPDWLGRRRLGHGPRDQLTNRCCAAGHWRRPDCHAGRL
jgi:acetyl-CoA C-acetyltransferase